MCRGCGICFQCGKEMLSISSLEAVLSAHDTRDIVCLPPSTPPTCCSLSSLPVHTGRAPSSYPSTLCSCISAYPPPTLPLRLFAFLPTSSPPPLRLSHQGYLIYSSRNKLLPQYVGLPGPEIKALKDAGVQVGVSYRVQGLGSTVQGSGFRL